MGKGKPEVYRHCLTSQDVDNGRILITREGWKFFPQPGATVRLGLGDRAYDGEIIAETCACVPPEHEHLYIAAPSLKELTEFHPGGVVTIGKYARGSAPNHDAPSDSAD